MSFPGDELVEAAATLDRTYTLDAPAAEVWPWLEQVGKGRAGWYAPRWFERLVPARFHALRALDPSYGVSVGDVVPDYGPSDFTVALVERPHALVFRGGHKATSYTWALLLTDLPEGRCRLHFRFRISKAGRVMRTIGDLFDHATVALLVAGLRERAKSPSVGRPG